MVYHIDGMELRTRAVYPTEITTPKAIKICLCILAVAMLIEMFFGGEQISLLMHGSNTAVFAGLLAWNL